MELFHAHHQWATRPADERFATLQDMYDACKGYRDTAAEARSDWSSLRALAQGDELYIVGKDGTAKPTHFAFTQIASRVGAALGCRRSPAEFLRTLPATLAAQNLNHGLARKVSGKANLLFHQNGSLVLRAATSDRYSRLWNYEVVQRLIDWSNDRGLVPAAPTFRQTGNDAPALYASDHDMFAFVMTPDRVVVDPVGQNLFRGLIAQNSEVGDCALKLIAFLFREICGNHIIWGAREVAEVRFNHVGQIGSRFKEASVRIRNYFDGAASLEEASFTETVQRIGNTKDEVLDAIFGKKIAGLTRSTLSSAYDAVVPEEDGDPRSRWGMVQGITRVSQQSAFADARTDLDRAAGKLLQITF